MIHIEFVDGSRSQLRMIVKTVELGPEPKESMRAAELLFSILRRDPHVPKPSAPDLEHSDEGADVRDAGPIKIGPSASIALRRRFSNPLYTMFGANGAALA